MEEPNLKIEPATIENEADFTKYGIQDFEIKVKASGNNLLFISETWYPKGWKAYLDENEIQFTDSIICFAVWLFLKVNIF